VIALFGHEEFSSAYGGVACLTSKRSLAPSCGQSTFGGWSVNLRLKPTHAREQDFVFQNDDSLSSVMACELAAWLGMLNSAKLAKTTTFLHQEKRCQTPPPGGGG
jgi:hypothetical protein